MFRNDGSTSAEATRRTQTISNRTYEHINLCSLEGYSSDYHAQLVG